MTTPTQAHDARIVSFGFLGASRPSKYQALGFHAGFRGCYRQVIGALSSAAPQHVCAHQKNAEHSPEGFGGQQEARGQA